MECIYCKEKEQNIVADSRRYKNMVMRRRKCLKCGKRFTTLEVTEKDLMAISKDLIFRIEELHQEEKK